MNLKEKAIRQIESGEYRAAIETILGVMVNVCEENNATGIKKELEDIEGKVFDIPDINWGRAEKEQVFDLRR